MEIQVRALLVGATLLPWSLQAIGGEPTGLQWRCEQRYDTMFHADCSLAPGATVTAPVESDPGAGAGTSHPGNRYVPVAMRPAAEIAAFGIWRVPLLGVPTDATNAERLLQSVLCGSAPGCSVRYEPGQPQVTQRVRHPFIR